MEVVLAMGLGDRLVVVAFWCGLISAIFGLVALITGFVGSQLSGNGVWETIKATQHAAKQASVRVEPEWGPFLKVVTNAVPPMLPMTAVLSFKLSSTDTRIPLQLKVSPFADGNYNKNVSGEAGEVEVHLEESQTLYISLGHPDVKYEIAVTGYVFGR
jgi:hypothetical protein